MSPVLRAKVVFFGQALLGAAITGALAMLVANLLAGEDLSGRLASQVNLGSGIVLAAVLGGLLGGWLALGGRRRIAGLAGLLLGILAGMLLWRVGTPYVWVIDVTLTSAFGEEGRYFTGLAALALLYIIMRWVAQSVAGMVEGLLARHDRFTRRPASPSNSPQA
jgi:MFS family permease